MKTPLRDERRLDMTVAVKRAYDAPASSDGDRVLVDRLWPRGLTKEKARIDHWLKGLAPSTELRQWYHASPNWSVFKKRYFHELSGPEAAAELETLFALIDRRPKVTLIYSSSNQTHNNAVALKELIEGMRKPPSSSGPTGSAATRGTARRRSRR